jgi:hypothetical protein
MADNQAVNRSGRHGAWAPPISAATHCCTALRAAAIGRGGTGGHPSLKEPGLSRGVRRVGGARGRIWFFASWRLVVWPSGDGRFIGVCESAASEHLAVAGDLWLRVRLPAFFSPGVFLGRRLPDPSLRECVARTRPRSGEWPARNISNDRPGSGGRSNHLDARHTAAPWVASSWPPDRGFQVQILGTGTVDNRNCSSSVNDLLMNG